MLTAKVGKNSTPGRAAGWQAVRILLDNPMETKDLIIFSSVARLATCLLIREVQ
jgi:hypothetical protein